jgi:hypothetical protein
MRAIVLRGTLCSSANGQGTNETVDALYARTHELDAPLDAPEGERELSHAFFSVLAAWHEVQCRSAVHVVAKGSRFACHGL